MKRFVTFVCFAVMALWPAVASAQKLVILVRHAERADGGSTSMQAQADPLLSAEGEARAQRLAAMLADARITAIYATEYKRTQDTAKPLAQKLGIDVRANKGQDTAGLVAMLKDKHKDDIVLVVGHSNTVPAVIKALGGPAVTMADSEYDAIYVLVPSTGVMTKIKY
jgi:broad specificity phosphatase PhoE